MSDGATIFALASGRGRAGVAVMRLSGPQAVSAAVALAGATPAPRRASLRRLLDADGAPIDDAVVIVFPAPNSFTGEDIVEFQTHGAPAVMRALIRRLAALPGLRPAAPGEFARRAFLNGRMDLAAAEGLADLIDSETDAQRRFALRQVDGAARRRCAVWMEQLTTARAALEATLDFSDEGDVDADHAIRAGLDIARDVGEAQRHAIASGAQAERIRDGFVVALVGRPNAGKSRLMNAMVGRDAAIVSETPGATRDVIEAVLDLDGWPVRLLDLAGLREAEEAVEAEGVRRATAAAESADLRLVLVDGTAGEALGDDLARYLERPSVLLWTKADADGFEGGPADALSLSAETGFGMDRLRATLADAAGAAMDVGEDAVFVHERQRAALTDCAVAIDGALNAPAPELAAESLRVAADALGRVVGRVDVEQVLDQVFGRFCIGK